MTRKTKILILALTLLLMVVGFTLTTYVRLHSKLTDRLAKGWILPPLELYSQGVALSVGRKIVRLDIERELARQNLQPDRDYFLGDGASAARRAGLETAAPLPTSGLWLKSDQGQSKLILWDESDVVRQVYVDQPPRSVESVSFVPRLMAQFYEGQPILKQNTSLGDIPLACLQATTAIEDKDFLEHGGVSATGTLRALLRNLRARRFAEGGSTITQQLVKNFFLSPKKTLRRKLEEQALAFMLEGQLSKDQILEMYLNVIYMGQSGPYQVRGFGSAAENYFGKPLTDLNAAECALLAALINNPGRYSPFSHPEAALGRRELVLQKMLEAKMLSAAEFERAKAAPVPKSEDGSKRAHAPYFVMTALKQFEALGIEAEEGARLYTTLDPDMQNRVVQAVEKQLPLVEAKIKKRGKTPLEVAVVTVDLATNHILALIGGREYRTTQFNRASESRRQVGSIVKPFVFWPALAQHSPLTPALDAPFEWRTGKQIWRPKNFEKSNLGDVPYFYALAHSMNIPTARVGQEVGLEQVVNTLKAAGIEEKIPQLPSLTLGALELSPVEVAQAYSTLARLGRGQRLSALLRVESLNGERLFTAEPSVDFQLEPKPTAVLVGMLEQVVRLGTARSVSQTLATEDVFAGKTGTTSESKDAWFAGFSPQLLTVVWVGYDDNAFLGLTGAGAALPIWTEIMRQTQPLYARQDFQWPDGIELKTYSRSEILDRFPTLLNLPEQVTLPVIR